MKYINHMWTQLHPFSILARFLTVVLCFSLLLQSAYQSGQLADWTHYFSVPIESEYKNTFSLLWQSFWERVKVNAFLSAKQMDFLMRQLWEFIHSILHHIEGWGWPNEKSFSETSETKWLQNFEVRLCKDAEHLCKTCRNFFKASEIRRIFWRLSGMSFVFFHFLVSRKGTVQPQNSSGGII